VSVTTITNRFIDGLKKEIKSVVMMHRPQDLDSMSSLALLQEEALLDPTNSSRRSELPLLSRNPLLIMLRGMFIQLVILQDILLVLG
jgi:hypothetical protein